MVAARTGHPLGRLLESWLRLCGDGAGSSRLPGRVSEAPTELEWSRPVLMARVAATPDMLSNRA
jgi:hypothetical protein